MTLPHEEVGREMERLLTAMTDGTLAEGDRRRLGELVRDEPDARRLYLDYCQMHALLKSAHGVLCAVAPERGRRRRLVWALSAIAAVLLLSVGLAWVMYQRNRVPDHGASVVAVRGEARRVRDGKVVPVQAGAIVSPGDGIQAGANSNVDLRLADGTTIQLGNESSLGLLSRQDGHRIELKIGGITCDVKPQDPAKPLVFVTQQAEVTVLGTVFELTAAPAATSVQVSRGRVRVTGAGGSIDVAEGNRATVDAHGAQAWSAVCDLDFRAMGSLPPQLETVFCDSTSLHTAGRKIVPGPNGIHMGDGGLRFVDARPVFGEHGLIVSRWVEEVGSDVAVEVEVSAGAKWSLGMAVDGDSFQGYRVIFAAPDYPYGSTIDSLYPSGQTLLAQDPRPMSYERDHTLRVEKQGQRMRVWVDREIRIDTEVNHGLAKDRKRTFAISNFGESPTIRSLRVWKAIPPSP